MEILLDTANIDEIRSVIGHFPVDGITTNPTILSKAGSDIKSILNELKNMLNPSQTLHIQTTAKKAEEIVQQAVELTDHFGKNLYIKIPVTKEGIKAVTLAKKKGLMVTVTAVFTASQALIAAKAGADYIAPYVNRIDNSSNNGVAVVQDMISILRNYGYKTKILGASFKNVYQVKSLASAGCHAVTLTPELLENLIVDYNTQSSLEGFESDWTEAFGSKEITDLI